MTDRRQHLRAICMLLLANLLWALSFPIVKAIVLVHRQLLPESGGWFVTAGALAPRFLLAAAILALGAGRAAWKPNAREWRQGVLLGLSGGAGMLFQNDGLQYTSASVSAFLTQFYAILIPVWVALRARRPPPPTIGLGAILVLAGVAILGRFDFRALQLGRGEVETLVGSLFFMGQVLLLGGSQDAANRALPVTFAMFAVEAAGFTALAVATTPAPAALLAPWTSPPWLAGTVALALFSTLGGFLLMNRWQPLISPTEAGLIYTIEPVFAALLALFLPGMVSAWAGIDYPSESVTWRLLVGGGLITAANVLVQARALCGLRQAQAGGI